MPCASISTSCKTPEEVHPFGKAGPRKKTSTRKNKSEVLTDTPVKAALATQKLLSMAKKAGCKSKGDKKAGRKLKLNDKKSSAKE